MHTVGYDGSQLCDFGAELGFSVFITGSSDSLIDSGMFSGIFSGMDSLFATPITTITIIIPAMIAPILAPFPNLIIIRESSRLS